MLWLTVRQSRRPPMSTIRAVTSTGMRWPSLETCTVSYASVPASASALARSRTWLRASGARTSSAVIASSCARE